MAAALAGVNGILTSNSGMVPSGRVPAGCPMFLWPGVVACAEAAAQEEVLAVGCFDLAASRVVSSR